MSNISESIREAALSWTIGYLGPVESEIIDMGFLGYFSMPLNLLLHDDETTARTFMLLVAEALE